MDITLNYVEAGEGFPLVLLHGNGEDHTYFEHQMSPFSAHYRVIAPDTRGHGKSPRGEEPFTLEQFAEDLKEFLDGLGIFRCHLLGFSDGGNIALIEEGDIIDIDIPNRTLNVRVSDEELAKRKENWVCPEPKVKKGYLARYASLVSSAAQGAVLKFN